MRYVGYSLLGIGMILFCSILAVPFKIAEITVVAPYAQVGIFAVVVGFMITAHSFLEGK